MRCGFLTVERFLLRDISENCGMFFFLANVSASFVAFLTAIAPGTKGSTPAAENK